MQTSDQINEIAAALAKAQGEMTSAAKDANNPHFKKDYATLQSVVDAVRGPLAKQSIAYFQAVENGDEDAVCVTTRLVHASGQWIESTCAARPQKVDVQGFGSAATYLRRYSLMGICGIAPGDDDDGNAAINDAPKPNGTRQAAPPRQPSPPPATKPKSDVPAIPRPDKPGQIPFPGKLADERGRPEAWKAWTGTYCAAIESAQTRTEIAEWQESNKVVLTSLAAESQKAADHIKAVTEKALEAIDMMQRAVA